MKMTLLELTQAVLRSIRGEQVDDIADTEESSIVAGIIKECYYSILAESNLIEEKTLFELNPSLDPNKPTVMYLPDAVVGLEWVKYNTVGLDGVDPVYTDIKYEDLQTFLSRMYQLKTDASNVSSFTLNTGSAPDSIPFLYTNDKAPQYFTSFDDRTLIFDSFDADVDTTLQKNKTVCFGLKESSWTESNNFIPSLDSQQFNLLLQEAKATAWAELRQVTNQKAERRARRSWVLLADKKNRANYNGMEYYKTNFPNYGRPRP